VSRICERLDAEVEYIRARRLDHARFPYIYLDATYLHVRDDRHLVSKAAVIATGVREDGHREVLGLDVGDSEDELFWRTFLTGLKERGLCGVQLVISDQHAGLVAAIGRCFQGAAHQRCRVHFARNLLATVPKGNQERVAAAFRTIFAQASAEEMAEQWDHVQARRALRQGGPPHGRRQGGGPRLRQVSRAHWRQIWSTNPLERLNNELKRRCRVVGIFPNETALVRLGASVLIDVHEEWIAAERRYFSENSMVKLYPARDDDDAISAELVPAR
jgi:putative transposase